MLTILASFAQEESRSVSENCKWRIRKRFAAGELVNLRFMYGYRIVKDRIEINPEQVGIVRMIFDDYINGMGGGRIAKKLRELGVPAMQGGLWHSERILEIIKNEKYTGNAMLQKRFVADHLTKKEIPNTGQLRKYLAEETHPAIIDAETYAKANAIMEQRRQAFRIDREEQKQYPFTGILRCGLCGKNFHRRSSEGCCSWICPTFQKEGKASCPSKRIPEPTLMKAAAEVLSLAAFDKNIFAGKITEILVTGANTLAFVFKDGHIVSKDWSDRSRAASWTDEMREVARQRAKERSSAI
jgi:site-specific DNA recombinase